MAFTIYRGTCTDPGVSNALTYLQGLDPQFCETRLVSGPGVLQSQTDGSGNQTIFWTETPKLDLDDTQGVVGSTFGDLVIIDSNNQLSRLLGPVVANQVLLTNAAGDFIFGPIPPATVPDPLTVANATVTTLAGLANVTISGTVAASGIPAGTIINFWGLDAANNVVKQSLNTLVVQSVQFFESPTSPSPTYPNENKAPGENLIIGNLLFDSGGALITVTDSVTLTVLVEGDYVINWGAMLCRELNAVWQAGIQLSINGIVVSNGGLNPVRNIGISQNALAASCSFVRRLTVGTTIRLVLAGSASRKTYEVWLNASRIGD